MEGSVSYLRGHGIGLVPDAEHDIEAVPVPAEAHYQASRFTVTDKLIRCAGKISIHGEDRVCGKLLAEYSGRPWRIQCPRCKTTNKSEEETR